MNIDPSEIQLLVRIAIHRTGRPLHDEDLAQDATLKAVEAFRKQFEIRYPRAFLRKVVSDAVSDYWRRRHSVEDLDGVDEWRLAESPAFEERLDAQRRVDLLRRALSKLEAGKRRTLDLFYMEERSVAEIAQIQNKSISAVKMDLLRARRTLAGIVHSLAREKVRGTIDDHENGVGSVSAGPTGGAKKHAPSSHDGEVFLDSNQGRAKG
jgi:RNA polymerase sigma factor (sigma-70 family)